MAAVDSVEASSARLRAAQRAERLAGAHSLAEGHMLAAAGIALVPLPLVDLAAVMGLQVKLVHSLAEHYGVPFQTSRAQSLVAALLSGLSSALLIRALGSLAKIVPGLGSLAGCGGMAVSFATVTYAVGSVFIEHFEAGGTLLDVDVGDMREAFRHKVETSEEARQPSGGTDGLEIIIGIGPVYARRLRAAGIDSFAKLAATPPQRIRAVVGNQPPLTDEYIASWIDQAGALAGGEDPRPAHAGQAR